MMVRRNLCGLLVLSLVLNVAFATENKENSDESEKKDLNVAKDEKTVSKRGILHHYSTHGNVPAVISYSHHHIPPALAVAKFPGFAKIPILAKVPVVVHKPLVPVAPLAPLPAPVPAPLPLAPAPVPFAPLPAPLPVPVAPPQPHYHVVPGGASVTSYSVNYPRALLPQPVIPRPFVPALGAPAVIPSVHHPVAPYFYPAPAVPHFHPVPAVSHYNPHFVAKPAFVAHKPVIPVAVPVPGIRYPKIPIYFNQPKPVYPQFVPSPSPTPTFVPVAVPANPQPAATNPGHGQMASQLMQQLALYQHQQQNQRYIQQQENSFPYPAAAETFQQSYDPPSNGGQYHGLSSYQVPTYH